MRFWDSSALIPLCLEQPRTEVVLRWLEDDPEQVVWWGSAVECASAIARLHREGHLTDREESQARELLATLRASWFEVQPGPGLREQAFRLLRLHPLRAADALQLAAAMTWSGPTPSGTLLTFDERLATAARREGFAAANA